MRRKIMRYSLINIYKNVDGFIEGVWIQDCTGTLEAAIKAARDTEKANSGRITVGVVESIYCPPPNYCYRTGLTRLD